MSKPDSPPHSERFELLVFLFITVIMGPAISVAFITVYGFIIWFSQLLMGPPGA